MAKPIPPFFNYYGSRWTAAKHYPAPVGPVIVEPFAGSAGYSLHYPDREVMLVDKYEAIVETWQYLIAVKESEILALPDIDNDGSVCDLPVCQEARTLIGWWVNAAVSEPRDKPSAWMRKRQSHHLFWGQRVRQRIANNLKRIRHWQVRHASYDDCEDIEATWFIDPPFQIKGKYYKHGSDSIDYSHLGQWCKSRRGGVIVCENEGATWLPFQPFGKTHGTSRSGARRISTDVSWVSGMPQSQGRQCLLGITGACQSNAIGNHGGER